jgi:hypothetical protein
LRRLFIRDYCPEIQTEDILACIQYAIAVVALVKSIENGGKQSEFFRFMSIYIDELRLTTS